jgi:hypothetical protein
MIFRPIAPRLPRGVYWYRYGDPWNLVTRDETESLQHENFDVAVNVLMQ